MRSTGRAKMCRDVRLLTLLGAIAGVLLGPTPARAVEGVPTSIGQALPGDGNSFGVALAGSTAVVGSQVERSGAPTLTRIEIFQNGSVGWSKVAKFEPPGLENRYGRAVVVNGAAGEITAAVGGGGGVSGAVYVYVSENGSPWSLQQTIPAPPDAEVPGDFGGEIGRVALSGNTLVIGGTSENSSAGAVWVYRRSGSTWTEQQKLSNPNLEKEKCGQTAECFKFGGFGRSVAVSGSQIAIGAGGVAYVYQEKESAHSEPEPWSKGAVLSNPEPVVARPYGVAVAIDGDAAVVGEETTPNPASPGEAWVFERQATTSNWTEKTQLTDAGFNDERLNFGRVLAMSGGRIVVGAIGAGYVFTRSSTGTWAPAEELGDPVVTATFGQDVGVSGSTEIVSVPRAEQNARVYGFGAGSLLKPEIGRCVKVTTNTGIYTKSNCLELAPEHNGSFAWKRGPGVSNTFAGSNAIGEPLFETVKGLKIVCASDKLNGEWTSAETAKVDVILKSCERLPSPTPEPCQTEELSNKGELKLENLSGELGFIVNTEKKVRAGLSLKPTKGSILTTFACGAVGEKDKIEGSVIGLLLPIDKMVPPLIKTPPELVFTQKAGRQVPEAFEGGVRSVLETTFQKSPLETPHTYQTGLSALSTTEPIRVTSLVDAYRSEEALEIKTKV